MIKNIAIVTVTFNSAHLASWFAKSAQEFEHVFVVDNSSADDTLIAFKKAIPHAQVLPQSKNLGFGSANNVGFNKAVGAGIPYVLFLNPDCQIDASSAILLREAFINNEDLGIVFPRVFDSAGRSSRILLCDFSRPYAEKTTKEIDVVDHMATQIITPACVDGACFLVKTKDFVKINGFNENLFMYCEEDDLGIRLHSIKKIIGLHLMSRATHLGGASSLGSWRLSIKKAYHVRWSRIYMSSVHISRKKAWIEAFKVILAAPLALIVYALLLRRANFIKWLGWWMASTDWLLGLSLFGRWAR